MAKSPPRHNKPYSPTENAKIKDLAKANTPTRVLGLKIGRTPRAVQSQASKLGVSLRPTNQRPYGTKKK